MEPSKPVPIMAVSNMEVYHLRVVLLNSHNQVIRVHFERKVGFSFEEVVFTSNILVECINTVGAKSILELSRLGYPNGQKPLTWPRQNVHLEKVESNGRTHKMRSSMVYKLLAALVSYREPYQNLREVYIHASYCSRSCCKAQVSKPIIWRTAYIHFILD